MSFTFLMIMLQIVTGILLSYLSLPPYAQALHIVLASLIFGAQFYLVLNLYQSVSLQGVQQMKWSDFSKLIKFRLTFLVVFSASISFLIGSKANAATMAVINWKHWGMLIIGGFLVTAAANCFNEIIEKDFDKLMKRTKDRPIPAGHMTTGQALVLGLFMAMAGTYLLGSLNLTTGLLSVFSILFMLLLIPR